MPDGDTDFPKLDQAVVDEMAVIDEVVHGHELDRSHTESDEVVDDRVRGQPEVGAPQVVGNTGVTCRHAAHVGLVDHGLVPGRVG